MAGKPFRNLPDDAARKAQVISALRSSRTRAEAASELQVGLGSLDHTCKVYGIDIRAELGRGEESVTVDAPPPSGLTPDELVANLKIRYARLAVADEARKLVPVRIASDMPIGLLAFGDLHLDDPGCNIELAEKHANLVRSTPGLWAITPGDFLNNWIGKLARLHGNQSVTREEGYALVEWFIELARDWLVAVLGNHDVWTDDQGKLTEWIAKKSGAWSQKHDVRLALRFSNGREVRLHCRHEFPGGSIYNDVHGELRAAIFGHRDHIKLGGHKHTSGYHIAADPDTGIAMHLLKVHGYKRHDDHARKEGYLEKYLGPSAAIVIDPRLPDTHPDLVHVFRDPEEGADYLSFKRKRRRVAA